MVAGDDRKVLSLTLEIARNEQEIVEAQRAKVFMAEAIDRGHKNGG